MRLSGDLRRRGARQGFTLIEIMVVVVIIGILAAAIIPNVVGSKDQAKVARAKADISTIANGLEQFQINMDRYPTTEEGLQALLTRPQDDDDNHWRGPYLKGSLPKDPWGRPYIYESPGRTNETGYDLLSLGKDGKEGGEESDVYNADIKQWALDDEASKS